MVVGGTLIAARLWAEGPLVPEINQCGLINTGRPPPSYTLKNIRRETAAGGAEDLHDCEIILTIEGYRDLVLHGYFYESEAEADLDRSKELNWDHVAGRKVALAWLAGATNLLLVSWSDVSASHGTGHYIGQWYSLARLDPKESTVLLKRNVCSSGRQRDVSHGPGIGAHFFSFDATTQILSDRMTFSRDLQVGGGDNIPPLHYEAKEGCEGATHSYIAQIRETVVHRYHYEGGRMSSLDVTMFYQTQAFDSARQIAQFYLGPLAPASTILKANPELRAAFSKDPGYEGGWFRLPPATSIRIPLPDEWITRFYE